MPWCPKCKTEYREGITICADCKTELVAEYRDVLLKHATELLVKVDNEHKMFIQKLHDFLEYSKIPSVIINDDPVAMIGLYVSKADYNKAKKCFKAFYSVETEVETQRAKEAAFLKGEDFYDYFGGDDEEDDSDVESPESKEALETMEEAILAQYRNTCNACPKDEEKAKFVSAISKYEDYRSSGYAFTVLGIAGIGFAVLNFLGVFSFFGSTFSSVVLFIMFAIFLGLGIFSFMKASTLQHDAELEKELISDAKEWMKNNFTEEYLASLTEEEKANEKTTAELLYMEQVDLLVSALRSAFPYLHPTLAEQLIEEFCNQVYDEP